MKALVFFSLLFSYAAHAAGQCEPASAEELSGLVFSQPLAKSCAMYRQPVDDKYAPLAPFTIDPGKADLRRAQGGAIFEKIKLDATTSQAATQLEEWINLRIGEGRIAHVDLGVHIIAIKQENICEQQVAKQFAGIREKAKSPEILKDIENSMAAAKRSCLLHNYGYANYVTREIVLGDATLERLGESVSRFAVLHELCHLQNPAIQGQSFEETFCDAVAMKWAAALSPDAESLRQLKSAFSIRIAPENENEELLALRSQLAVCCD